MSETKVTVSKVLDSSLWLSYFLNGTYKELVEKEETFILPALSLFEIKKKIIKSPLTDEQKRKTFEFLKNKTLLIAVDEAVVEKAVECAIKHTLGAADALIYATAILNQSTLVTSDNDFRGLPKVEIVSP